MENPNSKKWSREEVAKIEIGRTDIGRTGKICICSFFLILIFVYPAIQIIYEIRTSPPQQKFLELQPFSLFPRLAEAKTSQDAWTFNRMLSSAIKQYEDELENNSILRKILLSPAQYLLTKYCRLGNEKVIVGKGEHLFYRQDIKYLTAPGFLNPDQLHKRNLAGQQSNPLPAILDFHRQLKERNIRLILMPVPIKPMLYPDPLRGVEGTLNNHSYPIFRETLENAGITIIDLSEPLAKLRGKGTEVFLKTDTHWTPEGMRTAAEILANKIGKKQQTFPTSRQPLSSIGDLAGMLKLPPDSNLIQPESITLSIVDCVPERQSDILLMGDSFCNIFSTDTLRWGNSAGLPENLAELIGQNIDVLARNDAGAYATRELLAQELARGRDRLAGKRVVIWQFVIRELMEGNWKIIPLQLRETGSSDCFTVDCPEEITATVAAISLRPRPFAAPYSDHIMALHLVDINDGIEQALVYMVSMQNNKLSEAAKLRQNERIRIKVSPWADFEDRYGTWSRSEINDDQLLLLEPLWGEMP